MSAEALGWVYRHSPYKGATFAVHLAIADSVNDQADHEFWMRQGKLATKARCGRPAVNKAIATLLDDGHLELVEAGQGGANRYRFLMPDVPAVYDPRAREVSPQRTPPRRGPVAVDDTPLSPGTTPPVSPANTEPKGTQDQEPNLFGAAEAPPKARKGGRPPAFGDQAKALATAEWDRRPAKPVVGFVAIATRCQEALDAGHTADAIATAMRGMTVFSRNAFDLALGRRSPATNVRPRQGRAAGRVAPEDL